MSDTTVVVEDAPDEATADGSAGVAFAAGVAAATSQQAEETAEEAAEEAETAAAIAEGASETAWDARFAVEQLRDEMLGQLGEIHAALADRVVVVEEEPADSAPAPAGKTEETASDDTTEKSHGDETPAAPATDRGYGSKRWFG